MRRSLLGKCGCDQSKRRYFASSTAMRSAADIEEVGCPEPAAVVQRMLSTRSCAASSFHSFSWSAIVHSTLSWDLDRRSLLRLPATEVRTAVDVQNVTGHTRGVGEVHDRVYDVLDGR